MMSPSPSQDHIHLPGNTLEGGGQLVRLALCLSSITGIPVRITNIRGNRPSGGLKAQHLTAAKWLAAACDAKVEGLEKGSRELTFSPSIEGDGRWFDKETRAGSNGIIRRVRITQSSLGSIGLVLQAILPFLLFSGSSNSSNTTDTTTILLEITGGTNVSHSPSYEYICQVLLPALEKIGIPPISTSLQSRGWSVGGQGIGSMSFLITPLAEGAFIPPFAVTNNKKNTPIEIDKIEVSILAPREARKLLRRETRDALAQAFPDVPLEIVLDEDSQHAKRLYLLLVAHTSDADGRHRLGRDWLYDQKITNLNAAVKTLVHTLVGQLSFEVNSGSNVDEFLQDQLVVFQALARGRTVVTPGTEKKKGSLHAQTARWVAGEMLRVKFNEEDGSCDGVGFVAGSTLGEGRKRKEGLDGVAERIDGIHLVGH